MSFDTAETDRLLTTTRTVRKRLDLQRPVERSVIVDCVRLATQAPNGSNQQRWKWIVVDDAGLRRTLGDLYRRGFAPYMGDSGAVQASTGVTASIHASSVYLAEHLGDVPVLVIPCITGKLGDQATNREAAALYGSILPGVWSFMLALRSRGLGSAYTTLLLQYEQEVAELLAIPDDVTQVALLPVAYTVGDDFKPAPRQPAEAVTSFNGWTT